MNFGGESVQYCVRTIGTISGDRIVHSSIMEKKSSKINSFIPLFLRIFSICCMKNILFCGQKIAGSLCPLSFRTTVASFPWKGANCPIWTFWQLKSYRAPNVLDWRLQIPRSWRGQRYIHPDFCWWNSRIDQCPSPTLGWKLWSFKWLNMDSPCF